MKIPLARSELDHLQRAACVMIIVVMDNSDINAGDVLGPVIICMILAAAALAVAYHLSRPKQRALKYGTN